MPFIDMGDIHGGIGVDCFGGLGYEIVVFISQGIGIKSCVVSFPLRHCIFCSRIKAVHFISVWIRKKWDRPEAAGSELSTSFLAEAVCRQLIMVLKKRAPSG